MTDSINAQEKEKESKVTLREKALKYLVDPETEDFSRKSLALIGLGYTDPSSMYQRFGADELNEIYDEALALRRKAYASELIQVDKGMLKKAREGDSAAGKLMYQRFEKWSEKLDLNQTGDITVVIKEYLGKAAPSE